MDAHLNSKPMRSKYAYFHIKGFKTLSCLFHCLSRSWILAFCYASNTKLAWYGRSLKRWTRSTLFRGKTLLHVQARRSCYNRFSLFAWCSFRKVFLFWKINVRICCFTSYTFCLYPFCNNRFCTGCLWSVRSRVT